MKQNKYIAFTFDDVPSFDNLENNATKTIIDAFKKFGGKATFFIIGTSMEEHGDYVIKELLKEDFEIANHSYHHSNLTGLSKEEIKKEVLELNKVVKDKFGVEMKYFRPSGLKENDTVRETICELGFPMIYGSFGPADLRDWHNDTTSSSIEEKCVENAYDGQIVLMHGYSKGTAGCIERILAKLNEQGYKFVTLTELFEAFGQKELPCGRPIFDAQLKEYE